MSPWSAAITFTQKWPCRSMLGQEEDVLAGRNATSGGSSDTDVNEPMAKPTGLPSSMAVTTVTPVGNAPSTLRKWAGSWAGGRSAIGAEASPLARRASVGRERDGQAFMGGEDLRRP